MTPVPAESDAHVNIFTDLTKLYKDEFAPDELADALDDALHVMFEYVLKTPPDERTVDVGKAYDAVRTLRNIHRKKKKRTTTKKALT